MEHRRAPRPLEIALVGDVHPDLELVDALARLYLAARRRGCSIRVHGAEGELRELLELVGLASLAPRLGLELFGEAEGCEQLGVEEVVEPGDAPVCDFEDL